MNSLCDGQKVVVCW